MKHLIQDGREKQIRYKYEESIESKYKNVETNIINIADLPSATISERDPKLLRSIIIARSCGRAQSTIPIDTMQIRMYTKTMNENYINIANDDTRWAGLDTTLSRAHAYEAVG